MEEVSSQQTSQTASDKKSRRFQNYLIFICWLVYTIAQLGRYSYSANTTLIMDKYGVNHADAGLPTSFYFFAYGAGQIVVGLLCSKYNKQIMLTLALIISAVANLLLFLPIDFAYVKYIWAINGLAQANLWPVLLLALGENVSSEKLGATAFIMAIASTGGKFLAYGICALFSINESIFHYTFLMGSISLAVVAVLWFGVSGKLKKTEQKEKTEQTNAERKSGGKGKFGLVIMLIVFAEFCVISYAISGGLQQWVPAILKEKYGLEDSLSIFTSILLPLSSVPMAWMAGFLYKKLKNFVLCSALMFALGGALIFGVTLTLNVGWVIVIVLFMLICMAMSVISNQLTVHAPLYLKGKCSAGFLAGFLNGCCYIGSAVSTYGLGMIADHMSWNSVFNLLLVLAIVSAVIAVLYMLIERITKKRKKTEE